MRLMSFALTTDQIRQRTKTVTRRVGWRAAQAGWIVQPVLKGQGLKKGETVTRLGGPIRFTSVRIEPLDQIAVEDVAREGFPEMTPAGFVAMFRRHNGVAADCPVVRIEFEYVDDTDARA